MTSSPSVIIALQECLKYERTLYACYLQHHVYFARWRLHRPEDWCDWQLKASCCRVEALMFRLYVLDAVPADATYEVEPQPVEKAEDISNFFDYFLRLLGEYREANVQAMDTCRGGGRDTDSVSCGLIGKHQIEVEDQIQRFESKVRKLALVGPELYLAVHFRGDQGGS